MFGNKNENNKAENKNEAVTNEEVTGTQEEQQNAENLAGNAEAATAETSEEKQLQDSEKECLNQLKDFQDRYIRLMAEFDNFRKRTLKERTELIKTAGEDILVNILPVVDDFERGLQVIDKSEDIESVKQGVHLIYNKFRDFLNQRGVKEIESVQQPFNVDVHEAITKIPAPSEDLKGKVVDVVQKGYVLNEKVIRFAKVVVGE
ncbi:MAG TPA: nucleotide exchange factor GrpE [Bacteroidales bacterium]|nr:nucleotide exchange factor GrpE [Bacteroidales bacterium]